MLDSFPLLHCVSLSFIKGIYILLLVSFFNLRAATNNYINNYLLSLISNLPHDLSSGSDVLTQNNT